MTESTFTEFATLIDEALNDLRLAHADSEPRAEKQMLSDWWAWFSQVVVPDLLLKAETQRAPSPEGFRYAELAIPKPDEAFTRCPDGLLSDPSGWAEVSR